MCRVSVIVPVYNAEKYVKRCVESILGQVGDDGELIVIEDGSTDGTKRVLEEMAEGDGRIRLLCQKNAGPSAARNRGLKAARGEWIVFVDADDWLEAGCIAQACREAKENLADIVLWNMQNEYASGRRQREIPLRGTRRIFGGKELAVIEDMMLTEQTETGCSFVSMTGPYCKLMRKSITEGCVFPEHLDSGEDACFVFQVLKHCRKLVYIPDVFYHRTVLPESLSNRFDIHFWKRRQGYVNFILRFFGAEEDDRQHALDVFCSQNYELVARHYFLQKNDLRYGEKKKAVERYRQGVERDMHGRRVTSGKGVVCFLIRYRLFWCLALLQTIRLWLKRF